MISIHDFIVIRMAFVKPKPVVLKVCCLTSPVIVWMKQAFLSYNKQYRTHLFVILSYWLGSEFFFLKSQMVILALQFFNAQTLSKPSAVHHEDVVSFRSEYRKVVTPGPAVLTPLIKNQFCKRLDGVLSTRWTWLQVLYFRTLCLNFSGNRGHCTELHCFWRPSP